MNPSKDDSTPEPNPNVSSTNAGKPTDAGPVDETASPGADESQQTEDSAKTSLQGFLHAIRNPDQPKPYAAGPLQLDDYEILEMIGRGGMGIVYKARQKSLDRIVALKMILSGQFAGQHEVARFHAEAKAAAKLEHPGIVPIYEINEDSGRHFFSMAFVDGGSLSARVAKDLMSPQQAAKLLEKIAVAVAFAHRNGVIHRDLKPGNILLDAAGEPHITDFGLAKQLQSADGLTLTGQILGTPGYMPPEQALGRNEDVKEAADVYALGAILYRLLTGRPPFQTDSPTETLRQVVELDPAPPRQLNNVIPVDLETICLKCLHKDPYRRYSSAENLAADLARFRKGEAIHARRVSLLEKAWKWSRRRPALVAFLVTLAAATIGLLAMLLLMLESSRRFQANFVRSQVEALTTASAEGQSYVIASLASDKYQALPALRSRYEMEEKSFEKQFRIACALAEFGEPPLPFLLDAVERLPLLPGECQNVVRALSHAEQARALLMERSKKANDDAERFRYTVVLLHLGGPTAAQEMLANRADPKSRTLFIHQYAAWHGDIAILPELLKKTKDGDFRSGLCLALSLLPSQQLPKSAKNQLVATFRELYQKAKSGATHSAAYAALRKWNMAAPVLAASANPIDGRKWFVNKSGMTMLHIAPGEFLMGDAENADQPNVRTHLVNLTKPFYICDREVWVDLYLQFMKDHDYPKQQKPKTWQGYPTTISPTPKHPVHNVSWSDAVLFCNWLSAKEGRKPCYEMMNQVPLKDIPANVAYHWRWNRDAGGYRLPTEAEWEYACRAGTAGRYFFGGTEKLLPAYGTYSSNFKIATSPVASKLPNAWGLFDVHGNLWEWCWDAYQPYSEELQIDPLGPGNITERTAAGRAFRGGGVHNVSGDWRSASRGAGFLRNSFENVGFRVVCEMAP